MLIKARGSEDLQELHEIAQIVVCQLLSRPCLLHVLPHEAHRLLEGGEPPVVEVGGSARDDAERRHLELAARVSA